MHSASIASARRIFGPAAHTWNDRYAADGVRIANLVREVDPGVGDRVLDLGCGTGRAIPSIRAAIGESGAVIGIDVTPEMLTTARQSTDAMTGFVQADVNRLPIPDKAIDLIFAIGLLPHLTHPELSLVEFARVTRPGGRIAIGHVVGRVELARRHGGIPTDDDVISPARLTGLLDSAGWHATLIDDAEERFLALAERR